MPDRTMRPNPSPSKTTDYRLRDKTNTLEVIGNLHKDQFLILSVECLCVDRHSFQNTLWVFLGEGASLVAQW